jgi:hypothetical protein
VLEQQVGEHELRGRVAGSGLDRLEELRERHGAAMLRYPHAMATSIRIWSDYV